MGVIAGPQNSIVTDGLVLHLDAANPRSYKAGDNWLDLTLRNDVSLNANVTYDNSSIYFNGTGCILGPTTDLAITGDLTLSTWVLDNGDDTFYGSKITRGILGKFAGYGYGLMKQSNLYKFWTSPINNKYYAEADGIIIDNKWHMITGVRKNNINYIYVDSVLQIDTVDDAELFDSEDYLCIGRLYSDVDDFYWNSKIAICQIYNRALSNEEISQNYNALVSRFLNKNF